MILRVSDDFEQPAGQVETVRWDIISLSPFDENCPFFTFLHVFAMMSNLNRFLGIRGGAEVNPGGGG